MRLRGREASDALEAVARHARRAYPREACGLLLGAVADGVVNVGAAVATPNAAARPNRYTIAAREIWQVCRRARARGLSVVGAYHSHPDAPARPSAADAEAAFGGWVVLIQACTDAGPGEAAAWAWRDGGFVPLRLDLVGPRGRADGRSAP